MHLLQAGVDISVIALWLGHESIETTHIYLEADLKTKERALENLTPAGGTVRRYQVRIVAMGHYPFNSRACRRNGLPSRRLRANRNYRHTKKSVDRETTRGYKPAPANESLYSPQNPSPTRKASTTC
jgi:hypothetical protein